MIQIELSDDEARLFRDFRQYQDDFQRIVDAGAFGNMKFGKIILNIANGQLNNIVVEQRLYTRQRLTEENHSV